ncbi:hypothetical protein [Rhodococcus aetherivorans]|uniref:hypothetical protein n=1 Tax=Rhodococcus aetherivorans TaxID=191292 RepID=UPI001E321DA9|nr:hypothetical protein [Rhodococcus aetherivorans]UGQ42434.1 hypothetical protein LRQ66_03680 [Rhodococcus aetherivorans]
MDIVLCLLVLWAALSVLVAVVAGDAVRLREERSRPTRAAEAPAEPTKPETIVRTSVGV